MKLLNLDAVFDNDRDRVVRRHELTPDDLPSDWRVEYEERAAIREYDGNMTRELAEHYALLEIIEMMKTRA